MVNVSLAVVGGVLLMGIVLVVFLLWGLRWAVKFFINAALGFAALWLTKAIFLPELAIGFWNVAITAIFGVFGYIVVLILYFVGVF